MANALVLHAHVLVEDAEQLQVLNYDVMVHMELGLDIFYIAQECSCLTIFLNCCRDLVEKHFLLLFHILQLIEDLRILAGFLDQERHVLMGYPELFCNLGSRNVLNGVIVDDGELFLC